MRWKLACGALGALLLGTVAAQASDATALADRAGFLVGHAYRCGVAETRLARSEKLVSRLIAAYSLDDDDRDAARAEFTDSILASVLADQLGDPLPSCAIVRAELARLEQHRSPASLHPAIQGERQMVRDNRSAAQPSRVAATAKPGKSAKRATARGEELTAEQRQALETQRIAQQQRGRPPSI